MTAAGKGSLNGYTIGSYPPPMAGREDLYATPAGLVEVTRPTRTRRFRRTSRSGSFSPGRTRHSRSTSCSRSAFSRTQAYNRAIGNVPNSRHVFGDATDIFVDQDPVDGIMDDRNGDGRSDPEDNRVLAGIIEETLAGAGPEFVGGVGNYPATAAHGLFVHVDLRGYRARW